MGFSFQGHQTLVPHWGGGGTPAPTADFEADVVTGDAPVDVTFTNLTTGDGTITYSWDFGDGTPASTDENPAHQYTAAGTYTVTLTATNAGGDGVEAKTGYITIYETVTIQAGTDTRIVSSSPTSNFAGETTMYTGEWNGGVSTSRILISFNLVTLPDTAIISNATFSLYATADASSNARTFRVFRLKRAWVVNQATWNIYSTGNNWATAGGFGADDCEQTDIGNRDFSAAETMNQFKNFTLTPATKAALDLGNGWMVKADTEIDDQYGFSSFDNATAANRPKLVVRYTLP